MKQICTFPETIEYKSCTATIYQQQHGEAERFEVRYCDSAAVAATLAMDQHSLYIRSENAILAFR